LRFAVHRPGRPVASPRSHGVPRRDVPGRIHVSMARVSAGRAHEARLALTRPRVHLPARRATLARKRGVAFLHSAGSFLLQAAHQQPPPGRVFRPGLSELSALLRVTWRTLPARMPVRVLLNCKVPHVPGVRAVTPQYRLLGGRGDQTIPAHTNTLANSADISGEVRRRFLPVPKTGISTPPS
jgi:hypothetical protein